MRRENVPIWIVVGAVSTFSVYELHALNASVTTMLHTRMEDTQIASARWREINGIAQSITTYREFLESQDEFVRRHQDAVDAMARRLLEDAAATKVERR